ncbi:THUMP domain-containing protein 3 isoform X1 [Alosa sapidissima]|nr:THUMP domain-containing protein 3 isoform X1 [Alosa sapidissima]
MRQIRRRIRIFNECNMKTNMLCVSSFLCTVSGMVSPHGCVGRKKETMSTPNESSDGNLYTEANIPVNVGGKLSVFTVTIGATVPTGFEHTAAEEVGEKIEADARISKDRGRIYFQISTDKLHLVHHLKSVDNLFVIVKEFDNYQFKDSKEEAMSDLQQLASQLPWANALEVWRMNNSLKKRRGRRRGGNATKPKPAKGEDAPVPAMGEGDAVVTTTEKVQQDPDAPQGEEGEGVRGSSQEEEELEDEASKPLKFRVTCNRAGDKHSFTSNDAARDFGGAVQEFFQWKADMTKFDVEVLLNIHNSEVVIGIALTEESLHRRNITHFGPTTLRSTLAYGMLRLCKPQVSDVIIDPMCGTGAIPVEGSIEWQHSFFIAGDNNDMAVSRTVNNINHIQKKKQDGGSAPGLPVDTVQWDLCHLPMRTNSVDIIVTDMPFGKRMGSRKKNWDLYPSCLREMARVCRPGTGKAVLLTQDKKCFSKALSRMGGLWRKVHTVWVNVGGLHAGVFVLKRTASDYGTTPEDVRPPREAPEAPNNNKEEQ